MSIVLGFFIGCFLWFVLRCVVGGLYTLDQNERGVKTIGIDAPSIGSAHSPIPVHQEGLGRGMRYVEILTNLGELPVRGAYFVFLPVKISNSSGGPGRAMALLPE